jgi:nucleoside-diphosphate-sugar epimerase
VRIFVTGGTGYIGAALCRRLATDGHDIRALVRPASRRQELEALGATCFEGDITDRVSMREGMSGCDWVVHAAAELDFGAPAERIEGANVGGSENVASLAWKLGVGRVLAVSSIAAFGGSAPDGAPSTEESPPMLPMPSAYSRTKRAGEDAFIRWQEKGLRLNVVYPSLVYGPPSKKGGVNSLLRGLLAGRLPALVGANRLATWVYLDDLIDGLARVIERSDPGARYLMTGEAATTAEVVGKVCQLGGVAPPRLRLSPLVAQPALQLARLLAALVGRELPFVPDQIASLARHWNFDDSKARRELGWTRRGLDEGLPPTVEYLRGTLAAAGSAP